MTARHSARPRARPLTLIACILGGAIALSLPASAQTKAQDKKEVDVEADQMEVLQDEKRAVFTGNVDFRRGGVNMKSDKLVVIYEETPETGETQGTAANTTASDTSGGKKTEVTFLEASGNVTIVTSRQTITGAQAKMDVKANTVVVTGNVTVKQGQTVMRGNQLNVDLDKNTSQLTGGRVKGSFVPQ